MIDDKRVAYERWRARQAEKEVENLSARLERVKGLLEGLDNSFSDKLFLILKEVLIGGVILFFSGVAICVLIMVLKCIFE